MSAGLVDTCLYRQLISNNVLNKHQQALSSISVAGKLFRVEFERRAYARISDPAASCMTACGVVICHGHKFTMLEACPSLAELSPLTVGVGLERICKSGRR